MPGCSNALPRSKGGRKAHALAAGTSSARLNTALRDSHDSRSDHASAAAPLRVCSVAASMLGSLHSIHIVRGEEAISPMRGAPRPFQLRF